MKLVDVGCCATKFHVQQMDGKIHLNFHVYNHSFSFVIRYRIFCILLIHCARERDVNFARGKIQTFRTLRYVEKNFTSLFLKLKLHVLYSHSR